MGVLFGRLEDVLDLAARVGAPGTERIAVEDDAQFLERALVVEMVQGQAPGQPRLFALEPLEQGQGAARLARGDPGEGAGQAQVVARLAQRLGPLAGGQGLGHGAAANEGAGQQGEERSLLAAREQATQARLRSGLGAQRELQPGAARRPAGVPVLRALAHEPVPPDHLLGGRVAGQGRQDLVVLVDPGEAQATRRSEGTDEEALVRVALDMGEPLRPEPRPQLTCQGQLRGGEEHQVHGVPRLRLGHRFDRWPAGGEGQGGAGEAGGERGGGESHDARGYPLAARGTRPCYRRCMWTPLLLAAALGHQDAPLTVPEVTGHQRTSTTAEVRSFLEALAPLPHADRLNLVTRWGSTHEGEDFLVVLAGDPAPELPTRAQAPDKLRVLINANIHGGEVEGKEAVQQLLREVALGEHADLLQRCTLLVVPVYNADGNDRIDPKNRVSQNGPDGGVGERPNAQGLDLNRDFVKVESPECRTLLALTDAFDPHLWMDLHTTNGSAHGYHLTYAPSLATGIDPAIDAFARGALLPQVRERMRARHGFRVFDYGNFSGREQRAWVTYDHRPRFGTNYVGLRNRFTILSEAFSYLPFEERIEVTHAFVLECLRAATEHADAIRRICEQADRDTIKGRAWFGWETGLEEGTPGEILVGEVSSVSLEGLGTRRVAGSEWTAETMQVRVAFTSKQKELLPHGYAIPAPSQACQDALRLHGLLLRQLTQPADVLVQAFTPSEVRRARRPFQGHHELGLRGEWGATTTASLPAGTWIVTTRQPLGRVAAQLLEPLSEDSLSTWNVFEERTSATVGDVPGTYPVLRLAEEPRGGFSRVPPLVDPFR